MFFSCNDTLKTTQETIINDTFLDVIGTQGYAGSLIPAPPLPTDTTVPISDLIVLISPEKQSISKWKENILLYLKKHSEYESYVKLVNEVSKKTKVDERFNINKITRTGRYKIKESGIKTTMDSVINHSIGRVEFTEVAYDEKNGIAMYVITISVHKKAGFVKLILLDRQRTIWKIVHVELMEVW